jgi:uncharacterized protein (DUF58 family)
MGFGTAGLKAGGWNKADYARTVAATLAYFLSQQRDAVGAVTFGERIVEYLAARHRPGHLRRLMLCLERALAGESTDLAAPLEQIARIVRKRSLVVLVSDMLAPLDALTRQLGYLRSRGHEVIVMQTLDPAEVDFNFQEEARFVDLESGRELYVDPAAARRGYLAQFSAHCEAIRQTCRDLGIDFTQLRTDRPLEQALFDFVRLRGRGTGRAARARRGPGRRYA